MGPRPHLSFCACETTWLASELLVSMVPSPHLWFLHAKHRLQYQKYQSPSVPDLTCRFVHQNSVISTRITSLHGSQTSPVVLCLQKNVICIRSTSLHGSQTSTMALCFQNSAFSTRIASLYGSQPSSVVFACKTAPFGSELQVSMGPRRHLSFCACKTAWLAPE